MIEMDHNIVNHFLIDGNSFWFQVFWCGGAHTEHCNKIPVHISLLLMLNIYSCDIRCPGVRSIHSIVFGIMLPFPVFFPTWCVFYWYLLVVLIYISDKWNTYSYVNGPTTFVKCLCKSFAYFSCKVLVLIILEISLNSLTDANWNPVGLDVLQIFFSHF